MELAEEVFHLVAFAKADDHVVEGQGEGPDFVVRANGLARRNEDGFCGVPPPKIFKGLESII